MSSAGAARHMGRKRARPCTVVLATIVAAYAGCASAFLLHSPPACSPRDQAALSRACGRSPVGVRGKGKGMHARTRGAVLLRASSPGEPPSVRDPASLPAAVPGFFPLWESNVLQTFGLLNPDDAKVADLPILAQAIADRPKDYLQQLLVYYQKYGGIFKVCLMPKAFLIVSDPVVIRHILADSALKYDKGILADILEPIMGKGLIPADLKTWATRRRQLVPAFHTSWLKSTVGLFNECSARFCSVLDGASDAPVNMEAMYNSVALDIIGRAVFNYDFASVETQSPVIDAVYGLMQVMSLYLALYVCIQPCVRRGVWRRIGVVIQRMG